ncbi:endonuclease/exonuclease/phosphatase family protein [Actinocorallia sp. A-T 12471]|uniref:endonuclease/exonuclease/phosphatase family protein n=1 Tax=Actinocorallia sp. A-T 12471 TaxID=3089813 RepID=UPI0029CC80CC|nr:endonuclease/exonuclease/phosphatase family protein [Actinocorallia sp. A-T 12471]MDX6743185.1 endonuclease/exonuclease/phosphatase family protein [Actinocorallia sp. A-T 12471]
MRAAGARVLGYNLRSLRDDPAAVARVVRACAPDLLCLQEVPRYGRWRAARAALADAVGMRVLAGRRTAGLAVLGGPRVRLVRRGFHRLSWSPPRHRRALAVAVVEVGGLELAVASTHFALDPAERVRHVRELLGVLPRYGAPVVLGGDFNEGPDGPAWGLLREALRDAHAAAPEGGSATFPARAPRRRIDGFFTDPSLAVLGCGVPADPVGDFPRATDHLPVLLRL